MIFNPFLPSFIPEMVLCKKSFIPRLLMTSFSDLSRERMAWSGRIP
jgi:hypothetical protein